MSLEEGHLRVGDWRAKMDSPTMLVAGGSPATPTPLTPILSHTTTDSETDTDTHTHLGESGDAILRNPALAAYLRAEDKRVYHSEIAKSAAADKKRLMPQAAVAMARAGTTRLQLPDGAVSTYVPNPPKGRVTAAVMRLAIEQGLSDHLAIPMDRSQKLVDSFLEKTPKSTKTGGSQQIRLHRSFKRKRDFPSEDDQKYPPIHSNFPVPPAPLKSSFTWQAASAYTARRAPMPASPYRRAQVSPFVGAAAKEMLQNNSFRPVELLPAATTVVRSSSPAPPSPSSPTTAGSEIGAAALALLRAK